MKFTTHLFTIALLGVVACSNNKNAMTPPPPPPADTSSAKMVAYITKPDATMLLAQQPATPFVASSNTQNLITIDTSQQYQSMEGFGYTLTGGSAEVISAMPAEARQRLLQELFGNTGPSLNISFIRISIGASDLSSSVYTYNDIPEGQTDPEMEQFSLDADRDTLIPILKEILAIDPTITLLATPWTPPVWMKDNNSSIGGILKPEYYGAYAKYFVKYIQEMKNEGITIHAVTPQNEPLHPGNNPSLSMGALQQGEFIKNHLGPAFRDAGLNTRIILYDHNCDRPDYPLTILNDPAAREFVDGSAFHLYAGDISAMTQVHNAYPEKHVYFTEQYTAIDGQFGGDLQWHIKNLVIGAPRNWSRTVLEWNLANNTDFGPHTPGGCTTCKGALTIDGSNVKRNVAYYIIAHASRFVPPGSVRVSSSLSGKLLNVAFKTPEGKIVVIVLNENENDSKLNIKVGDRSATADLPAGAVGTFVI